MNSWRMLPGEAWRAMVVNPLRTGLTVLGIVIGVAAVVLMLAVGEGARLTVSQSIASMGSDLFIVLSGASTSGGLRFGSGSSPTLTLSDSAALARLPTVKSVAPVSSSTAQLAYGAANWSTVVYGTTPEYLEVRDWGLESGQSFTAVDQRRAARVVLLGQTVARNLFGGEAPVGRTIRIKNQPFQVVGLLEAKGQSLDGRDQDDSAFIPVSTAHSKLFGNPFPGTVRFIMVRARSAAEMGEAEEDITQLLRTRHRIAEKAENDFTVRNLSAAAQTACPTPIFSQLWIRFAGALP